MFLQLGPNLFFNFRRGDKDEVVYLDGNLDIELLVIEETGTAFHGVVAESLHNFMQLFVPYGTAFGVAVQRLLKDTNGVNIFWAAIRVKPRFGP